MSDEDKPRKKTGKGLQASPRSETATANRNPFIWWLTGLGMGLLVALLVHLEHTRPDTDVTASMTENTAPAGDEPGQPRFEFYRLLSEQEVEVANQSSAGTDSGVENPGALPLADEEGAPIASSPQTQATDEPTPSTASTSQSQPATAASDGARYLLQAGSFRQQQDADALRANLALLGIDARIERVELPGGETWHRVRIGPFASLSGVNEVRARMASQQIDSILLRSGG